ncbi:hypothetical protein [Nitrosopumilus sp.]|uniref:hypothetical protein n=1 Tax=Nitrosopumilus sp. TaxID=2024843 RepID=UPI003B5B1636
MVAVASVLMVILVFTITIGAAVQSSYAQTANNTTPINEQVTLSENLADSPLAQDILRKIEQTKKWIAELEERDYDRLEKQRELEEKRQESLAKLNQDLKEWERLWDYYSPKNSYERFVDKIPDSQVQEVFWDQFEFKEQKVKAGRDAFKQSLADGNSRHDALQAYVVAAETKRIELIEANSQFNVRHNLAYYSQQILFDRQGQFVDSPVTGEQLRKYYEDYRTNPAYLDANPDDKASWEEMQRTNQNTECREGQIVMHRFHADDYVCVTMKTAEMWIKHGMGEITGDSAELSSRDNQLVTPLTRCDDGFVVVYHNENEKYSCVLNETAEKWAEQRIVEFPNPEEYIMKSIERKETLLEIEEVNQKIREIHNEFEEKKMDLKRQYDAKYAELLSESKEAEKRAIQEYDEGSDAASKEELSRTINSIREKYESDKEDILDDKVRDTKRLEREFKSVMAELVQNYDDHPYFQITSDSANLVYEAIARE